MKYLTKSYVEWLGLQPFPTLGRGVTIACYFDENLPKPLVLNEFELAIAHNDDIYIREPDGLAWRREET